MALSLSSLLDIMRSDAGRKKLRYAGVSLVFVPVGQVFIQLLGRFTFDRDYTKASLVSAAVLTLPNFFANKFFVWRDTNRDKLRTQVIVFWFAAMLGVALATTLTWLVEKAVTDKSALLESGAVFLAQLTGFGLVWIGRFIVLDRWLFRATHHGAEPTPEEMHELHADLPI